MNRTTIRQEIQTLLASSHYKGNKEYEMRSDELANLILSKIERKIEEIESHSSKRGWIHIEQIKMEMFE